MYGEGALNGLSGMCEVWLVNVSRFSKCLHLQQVRETRFVKFLVGEPSIPPDVFFSA